MDLDLALDYNPFDGDFGTPGDRQFRDKIVTFRKGGTCRECLGPIEPKTKGRSLTMYWADDGVVTYRISSSLQPLFIADMQLVQEIRGYFFEKNTWDETPDEIAKKWLIPVAQRWDLYYVTD